MNIDEMQAGPELDAFMAVEVMRWHVASWRDGTDGGSELVNADGKHAASWSVDKNPKWRWSPSTDIIAAWQVFCKLTANDMPYVGKILASDTFSCHFTHCDESLAFEAQSEADTVELAICRAALRATREASSTR